MSFDFENITDAYGEDEALGTKDNEAVQRKGDALRKRILAQKAQLPDTVPQEDKETLQVDQLNKVVGEPTEMDVQLQLLKKVPEEWNCFPTATTDDIIKMCASIEKYGLLHRITLWEQDGGYIILGGNTRAACYSYLYSQTKDEKYSAIPALVYNNAQLTEIDAHRIFIVSNTDQRKMSAMTISRAYADLLKLEKEKAFYGSGRFARDAAAEQAGVGHSSFARYLHLLQLYPPLSAEIDSGALAVRTAYELSFLDEEIQKYIYDNDIYLGLSIQAAKKIRSSKSIDELKQALKDLNEAPKYYKYQISTKVQKPSGKEIVPLFVDKERKQEFIDRFKQAITESNYDENLKKELLAALG